MNEFVKLAFLSLPCAGISVTISRAKVFGGLRGWLKEHMSFIGELISCPYCTSHWVAFVLLLFYFPRLLSVWVPVDFLVSMMALVTMTAFPARVVYWAYDGM